jgi:hypothetical protein
MTAPARSRIIPPVVLGGADGVTIVLGILVSLTGHPAAMWHAALGAGLAELVGMTAGMWLSDGEAGFRLALCCGLAAFAACVAPAVPYLITRGPLALAVAVGITVVVAAAVTRLRPEKGVLAAAQTYGVLIVAVVLCYGAALI